MEKFFFIVARGHRTVNLPPTGVLSSISVEAGGRVGREIKTSKKVLSMGGLAGQQVATEDLFIVSRIGTTGEAAAVATQVAEEALG